MSDILCPSCFTEITTSTAEFECTACGTKMIVPSNVKKGGIPKCTNSGCRKISRVELKCKQCGYVLPNDMFQYEKYIPFSIVGISGSGKTNYVTTMIQELKTSRMGLEVTHMNSETSQRFKEEKRRIYNDHEPSDSTNSGEIYPYQWRIRKESKSLFGTKLNAYSMTIFDGAGEDMQKMYDNPELTTYIAKSKYIVFLVDPMALENVRDSVSDKDLVDWSSANNDEFDNDASLNLVQDMSDFIRQSCQISVDKKIKVPVAIVFTKIDLILDQFGSQKITEDSPHAYKKGFDINDANMVNEEIQQYLEDIGEDEFLQSVKQNFPNVRFFGVSSYGNSPVGKQQLSAIDPHRVLDPILWILSEEKIVPKMK